MEGFVDAPHWFYLDEIERRHSIEFTRCANVTVTIPKWFNHLNGTNLNKATIRIERGLISGVELTRCTDSRIFISGTCHVLQIDLCDSIAIHFASDEQARRTKIVHASSVNITVFINKVQYPLNASLFHGDQQVSFYKDGHWNSVLSQDIKNESRGYLDLTAVGQ